MSYDVACIQMLAYRTTIRQHLFIEFGRIFIFADSTFECWCLFEIIHNATD